MKDILAKLDELTKRKKLTESHNVSEQLDRDKVKEAEWDYNPFKDGSAQDYGYEGDTEDYIIKLWNQGMDVKEIAAELDADLQLVKDTVDKYEDDDYYDDEPAMDDPAHDEWYARNRFAEPGSGSALHAADETNPRSYPCPSCERENMLTKKDVMKGYRCDRCANASERGMDMYETQVKKSLKDYISESEKEVDETIRLGFGTDDGKFKRPETIGQRGDIAKSVKGMRQAARSSNVAAKKQFGKYDDPESMGAPAELPTRGIKSVTGNPAATRNLTGRKITVAKTGAKDRDDPLYVGGVVGSSAGKNIKEMMQKTPIPVVGKEGEKTSAQAGFVHIDDTSPAGKAMSQALSQLAKDKKAQIVVPPNAQKPGTTVGSTLREEGQIEDAVMSFQTRDDDESMDYHRMADVYKEGDGYTVIFTTSAPGMRAPNPLRTKDVKQAEMVARKYTGNDMISEAKKAKNDAYAIGMAAAKKAAGIKKKHVTGLPKNVLTKGHKIGKKIKKKQGVAEAEISGAGLDAGRSRTTLEAKKKNTSYAGALPGVSNATYERIIAAAEAAHEKGKKGDVMRILQDAKSALWSMEDFKREPDPKVKKRHVKLAKLYKARVEQIDVTEGAKGKKHAAMKHDKKAEQAGKKVAKEIKEAEIPGSQVDLGAGLGAGRSRSVLESPMDEPVIINTPEGIKYMQMAAARGAINLEKKGLRHSKIGSVKNKWAKHLGMRPRATHDEVIAELEKRMQKIKDNLSETKISKAVKAGKKVAKDIEYDEKVKDKIHGKKRHAEDEKAEKAGKKVTKDLKYDMKKSTKKKVKESMNPKLKAAYQEGYAHGLREQSCRVKHYEDMEEAKKYYEGYKCGLDEFYGMMPVQGLVVGEGDMPPATVSGMAQEMLGIDENLTSVGMTDDRAAKMITDKLKGLPGINAGNIDRYVSRYLDMVGKHPTDLKHLSVLVLGNLQDMGLDETMLMDAELDEMMTDIEEMSRGEYISHMDKKAEHAGKDTFDAFGQKFNTDEVKEGMADSRDVPMSKAADKEHGITRMTSADGKPVIIVKYSPGVDKNKLKNAFAHYSKHARWFYGDEYISRAIDNGDILLYVSDNDRYLISKGAWRERPDDITVMTATDNMMLDQTSGDFNKLAQRFPFLKSRLNQSVAEDYDEGWSMEEDSNDMFESLDKQLNDLLNEGLSVSVSTGQPGMQGDSVSVNATDDDAAQLLDFVKKVGLGGLSAEEKHEEPAVAVVHSDYGAPSHQPDDRTSMLALMKKMNGEDYEQESDEGSCGCEAVSEMETDDQRGFQVAEGDGEDAEVEMTDHDEDAEAKEDEALAINNIKEEEYGPPRSKPIYTGPEGTLWRVSDADTWKKVAAGTKWDVDMIEHYLGKGPIYVLEVPNDKKYAVHFPTGIATDSMNKKIEPEMLKKIKKLISGAGGGGMNMNVYTEEAEENLNEWANDAGKKGTDEAFEADIDFMTNVITAGLNGRKSTGQTTVPVIAGQTARTGADSFHESKGSIAAWQKLCGIR